MSNTNTHFNCSFGSDNHWGVHPQFFESLIQLNSSAAAGYEQDDVSLKLKKWIQTEWGCKDSHLVFTGTAANVLALSLVVESYHTVLCTDISHLNVDECNSAETLIGCKLVTSPHKNGKLLPQALEQHWIRRGDPHHGQLRAVSLSQPTEYGTVYTLEELSAWRRLCQEKNLLLHIDGARLANAAVSLQCSLKDIIQQVDVVSFGGTKNGLLAGELILVNSLDPERRLIFRRKQWGQLPSKTRFFSQQFLTYLQTPLWREIAAHQCQMAQLLAAKLSLIPGINITHAVESNAVFCFLPEKVIKPLRKEFFFYVWNESTRECRLMTSFATQKEHIEHFAHRLKELL